MGCCGCNVSLSATLSIHLCHQTISNLPSMHIVYTQLDPTAAVCYIFLSASNVLTIAALCLCLSTCRDKGGASAIAGLFKVLDVCVCACVCVRVCVCALSVQLSNTCVYTCMYTLVCAGHCNGYATSNPKCDVLCCKLAVFVCC